MQEVKESSAENWLVHIGLLDESQVTLERFSKEQQVRSSGDLSEAIPDLREPPFLEKSVELGTAQQLGRFRGRLPFVVQLVLHEPSVSEVLPPRIACLYPPQQGGH